MTSCISSIFYDSTFVKVGETKELITKEQTTKDGKSYRIIHHYEKDLSLVSRVCSLFIAFLYALPHSFIILGTEPAKKYFSQFWLGKEIKKSEEHVIEFPMDPSILEPLPESWPLFPFWTLGQKAESGYEGLKNLKKVEGLLQQEQYKKVAMHLNSEPNTQDRINFLEKAAEEGHAFALFALAEEYFDQSPTEETLHKKTLPLFEIANVRARMDLECSNETEGELTIFSSPRFRLARKLEKALPEIHKKLEAELSLGSSIHREIDQQDLVVVAKKYLGPFAQKDHTNLPSPRWTFQSLDQGPVVVPQSKWPEIRREAAQKYLSQLHSPA